MKPTQESGVASVEADFAMWLRRSDPEALGRVFDATASRLLLLAHQLTGRSDQAEDLTQQTFVRVLRSGHSWQSDRPLWPWLAAILHNEFRQMRRRRAPAELAEDSELATRGHGPLESAVSNEGFARVSEAIDALAPEYRRALHLRLIHGLSPVQIARALETPQGTIRARLSRGLQKLRDSLPRDLGQAVSAWIAIDVTGLSRIRTAVISASSTPSTPPPHGLRPWARPMLAAAALLAVLAVAAFAWSTPDSRPELDGEPLPPPALTASTASPVGDPETPTEDHVAERTPTPTPRTAIIVRTKAGQPIADATVRVFLQPRLNGMASPRPSFDRELATGPTDSDGRFDFDPSRLEHLPRLTAMSSLVRVEATPSDPRYRRADRWFTIETSASAGAELVVEVAPTEATLIGRVIDLDGKPVRGARVCALQSFGLGDEPAWRERSSTRTDADGRFHVYGDSTPIDVVAAFEPAHGAASLRVANSVAGRRDIGTLRLAGRGRLLGRVELADTLGLAHYPIEIAAQRTGRRAVAEFARGVWTGSIDDLRPTHIKTTTNGNGSIVCRGLDPRGTYRITLRDVGFRPITQQATADGGPFTIRAEGHLWRVRTVGPGGSPIAGAQFAALLSDESATPKQRGRITFFPVDPDARRLLLCPPTWSLRFESMDEFSRVTPDASPRILSPCRMDLDLRARSEHRFGSLQLLVRDTNGDAYDQYGVILDCLDRTLSRNQSRQRPPADGRYDKLPAGRWRLTVHLGKELAFPTPAYARGTVRREVTILDGETTTVELTAPAAGLIAFEFDAELTNPRVIEEATGKPVPLHEADHRRILGVPMARISKRAFSPGRHVFRISAEGRHAVRRAVVVAADALTPIRVEVPAK